MIVGLGLDIVEVSRVSGKLATRILSKEEYELWQKRGNKDFLAGRFALKEAFFKALGTGIRNYELKDVSFVPDSLGKLHVEENEVIKEIKKKYEFEYIHATLSHDGGIAAAVVIFERRDSK
jgi:holo-[acyl-carrier-protein] synthase